MKKVLMMLVVLANLSAAAPIVVAAEGGECWYPPSGCRPVIKPPTLIQN